MDSKIIKIVIIYFLLITKAFTLEFTGKFLQGHFILGKTNPGSKVLIDKKKVKYSKNENFE